MAYATVQGQMNASAKAKVFRYVRQLGPKSDLGSIDNPNKRLDLEYNTKLRSARPESLERNSIGAEGASKLAEALQQNTSLTTLYLCGNNIGDEGAANLAEALQQNTSLTKLDLSYNDTGAEGAAKLAEALKQNAKLSKLDL